MTWVMRKKLYGQYIEKKLQGLLSKGAHKLTSLYTHPFLGYALIMSSLNECNFIGHVGADPEFKEFQSGDRVANFSIACTEKWKGKDGNPQERTEWVRISCTNQGLLKVIEGYVKKGTKLFVQGKLETRKWQDQSGADRYSTEVVLRPYNGKIILLGGKSDNTSGSPASQHDQAKADGYQPEPDADEIPF